MSVLKHNKVLYEKVRREFFNNCLWHQIDGQYIERKEFYEAILFYIFNLCELNPTDKVANMIHQVLNRSFLELRVTVMVYTSKFGTKFYLSFGKTIKL